MANYGFSLDIDGNATEALKKIRDQLKEFNVDLERLGEKKSKGFSGLTDMIKGSFLGNVGANIASSITSSLSGAGRAILKLGSDMQQTKISFEVMLGSAEKANKMVADLKKMAETTPFESKEVFEGAKKLMNYGVAAQNVLPYMRMLGDVSGGNAEKMQYLTTAFGQMQSIGRLMGQDLLQMINAGFNPLEEISRKTGVSIDALKEKMSKGGISSDEVIGAFRSATSEGGRYFGMMDKQSKSVAGLWSTTMDNISSIAIKLFDKLEPYITKILNAFINNFGAIEKVLKGVWGFLSGIVKALADFFRWLNSGTVAANAFKEVLVITLVALALYKAYIIGAKLATLLWTSATKGLKIALDSLSKNPIGLILTGIVLLIVAVMNLWDKCEGFRRFFGGMGEEIVKIIKGIGNFFANLGKTVWYAVTGQWDKMKESAKAFTKDFKSDFLGGWKEAWKTGSDAAAKSTFKFENLLKFGGVGGSEAAMAAGLNEKGADALARLAKNGGAVEKAASNTSRLSGASGGLGEAKVIKIDFHKALQEINIENGDGKDVIAKSQMATEVMLRVINNLAYSQGVTM